jgi:hypothetical protein
MEDSTAVRHATIRPTAPGPSLAPLPTLSNPDGPFRRPAASVDREVAHTDEAEDVSEVRRGRPKDDAARFDVPREPQECADPGRVARHQVAKIDHDRVLVLELRDRACLEISAYPPSMRRNA